MYQLAHAAQQRLVGGVLGVYAGQVSYQLAHSVVFLVVVGRNRYFVPGRERAADYGAEAAVYVGLGVCVAVEVHVEAGRYAAGDVLEYGQAREGVDRLGREPRLQREDLVEEPALQRQVVCERAQEGHRRVGVRVLKTRYHQVAAEVDFPLKLGQALLHGRAHVAYLTAVRPELALKYGAIRAHGHDTGVMESYHVLTSQVAKPAAPC